MCLIFVHFFFCNMYVPLIVTTPSNKCTHSHAHKTLFLNPQVAKISYCFFFAIITTEKEIENDDNANNVKHNKWNQYIGDHNKAISIGRIDDDYKGVRVIIGGNNQHLLFITYSENNISIFNLLTFEFILHDKLPIASWILYHCFTIVQTNIHEKNTKMILFHKNIGLAIYYNQIENKIFLNKLSVDNNISLLQSYSYVGTSDQILIFGGFNSENKSVSIKALRTYIEMILFIILNIRALSFYKSLKV
ncbi:hypothetical protein RFI_00514 [Reticulomyxa filosa]|uniref:Uncharacterized protein n=1 Tax=Reticulomyxa filosa TaxID=46433 RepID=X6PEL4_RETFI|nr:hypothetical protein RFI_00514 [Reticulomyxa filosa]|eukprot:ETO36548.1 hypothetical protein RFI_00514 [Reticulomyxa filosa]